MFQITVQCHPYLGIMPDASERDSAKVMVPRVQGTQYEQRLKSNKHFRVTEEGGGQNFFQICVTTFINTIPHSEKNE